MPDKTTPAAATVQPERDENAGKGGLYRKADGQRTLVARTQEPQAAKPVQPKAK